MSKSFCIKTNNKAVLNYLLKELELLDLDDIYMSKNKFKIYNNIIIHYKGNNLPIFLNLFSRIITSIVVKFYEKKLLTRILNLNYFYFLDSEKKEITDLCLDTFNNNIDEIICSNERTELINDAVLEYINKNNKFILDGFINFRLKSYIDVLDNIVDFCVNKFLIEREYIEFINLLKIYIDSKEPETELVHLIYANGSSILLDNNKNIIDLDDDIFKAKYISDISFSSNDYALNTLLNLLPKKITIHLVDLEDEFINTLLLVFSNRVMICTDCNICKTYMLSKNIIKVTQ